MPGDPAEVEPRWHDLTRPLDADAERSRALPQPTFESLVDAETDGASVQRICLPSHCGTHVDAPSHVLPGGATLDEYPLDRLAGEGVVLSVDADEPRPVAPADLDGRTAVRTGDAVILSFGWADRAGTGAYHRYPWLSADLTDWLLEREVRLLGLDTLSPDEPRELRDPDADPYPAHRALLGAGVPVVENLADPSGLVGGRVEVVAAPIPVRGGDGAPARVLARPLE